MPICSFSSVFYIFQKIESTMELDFVCVQSSNNFGSLPDNVLYELAPSRTTLVEFNPTAGSLRWPKPYISNVAHGSPTAAQ